MPDAQPDPEAAFRRLLARVRQGDAVAASQLVQQYEAEIRRAIRLRLTDGALRRVVDSMDICQSVMGQFFVHVSQGQFDLESPADLIRVLVTMVRNKVIDQARHLQAQRRDVRMIDVDGDSTIKRVATSQSSPASAVANQDLVAEIRARFSERERQVADLRASGRTWPEVASELGMEAEAVRKLFARALDRIAAELRIEELR